MKNLSTQTNQKRVLIWDIPVRLFHWTQLALFIALIVTAEVLDDKIELHAKLGMALLALVLFRLSWGIVGSRYARFSQFLKGPRAVLSYISSLFSHKEHVDAGHNPLGGWMVLILLLLLLTQATLGLFANDDIMFDGPLAHLISKESSDQLTGLHEDLFHVLLILVGIHVAAVIGYRLFKGKNLITPMFTGYKTMSSNVQIESITSAGLLRALALLLLSTGLVYWLTSVWT